MEKNNEKEVKVELSDTELSEIAGGSGETFDMMSCVNAVLKRRPELKKTPDRGMSFAWNYCTTLKKNKGL